MAFETLTPLISYPADGVITQFDIPDKFYEASDVKVFYVDAAGEESQFDFGTDYSVVITATDPTPPSRKSGRASFNTPPINGGNVVIFIWPDVDQDQPFEGQPVTPRQNERVHDRHAMRDAALRELLFRGFRAPLNAPPALRYIEVGAPGRVPVYAPDGSGSLVEGPSVGEVLLVSGIVNEIIAVAAIAPQVVTVADNITDVQIVAANIAVVSDVSLNMPEIVALFGASQRALAHPSAPPDAPYNAGGRRIASIANAQDPGDAVPLSQIPNVGFTVAPGTFPLPLYQRVFDLTPEDFGYDTAPNLDQCRIRLNAWAAAAGRKRMRSGVRYYTNGPIIFGPSTTLLDMDGAVIDTTAGETAFGSYEAAISFRNAPEATVRTLGVQAVRGDYYIDFPANVNFAPGTLLQLWNSADNSFNSWRDYYREGEFAVVDQVNNQRAYLTSPLRGEVYPTATTQIRVVPQWKPRIIGGEGFHSVGNKAIRHLDVKWATGARLEGVKSGPRLRSEGIVIDRSFESMLIDCETDQFVRGTVDGITDHYGLGIYNSQSVKVVGGRYVGGNHGIALGGDANPGSIVNRDIDVSGADIKAWYLAGTSIHGNAEDVNFRGCKIDGGATFGGDKITYSDCLIRMGPLSAVPTTQLAASFYAVYTAEAHGVSYSLINTRIEAFRTPPGYPNLPAVELGTQEYITAKTKRGGTIRIRGVTIEAPTHNRIIGIANNGNTSPDRRIEVDGVHVYRALQGGGRIYDVGVFNTSGVSWASNQVTNVFARGGAIIV